MLVLTERLPRGYQGPVDGCATLPLDVRVRSRARIRLDDGRDAGFVLDRGQLIRGGDVLQDESGTQRIGILAAAETVSTVRCTDPLLLARLCYHLGNRHVPLQIGAGFARYQHDHVLDEMVRGLGGQVQVEEAPFEPEAGAYHSSAHHRYGHDHAHAHAHEHGHGHGHGDIHFSRRK